MSEKWKLLPVEPTSEMRQAVHDVAGPQALAWALAGWETMVGASPPPPSGSAWGVKVKPLEWSYGCAQTMFGRYVIEIHGPAIYAAFENMQCSLPHSPDPETAMAAAQADYEARILSALTPSPSYAEGIEAAALWHDRQAAEYATLVSECDDPGDDEWLLLKEAHRSHVSSARYIRELLPAPPNVKVAP